MVRIRNGSPGSRAKNDQKVKEKEQTKKDFEEEMVNHGMNADINEIGRFNYVLMSRSVDFD